MDVIVCFGTAILCCFKVTLTYEEFLNWELMNLKPLIEQSNHLIPRNQNKSILGTKTLVEVLLSHMFYIVSRQKTGKWPNNCDPSCKLTFWDKFIA